MKNLYPSEEVRVGVTGRWFLNIRSEKQEFWEGLVGGQAVFLCEVPSTSSFEASNLEFSERLKMHLVMKRGTLGVFDFY